MGKLRRSAGLSGAPLAMVVPGSLDQLTGGYLFDRHIVEGLRAAGRCVRVIELPGHHPDADAATREAASAALQTLPDDSIAVLDGLALPGCVDAVSIHAARLRLLGFIHHPLSLETGLEPAQAERLAALEHDLWPQLRGLLCPSAHTAHCLAAAGIAPSGIAVVPPGTERPVHPGPARQPGPVLQLLSVGSVVPRKGHALLVEALAGLADLPWHLTCIGSLDRDRDAVAGLRAAIDTFRLGDRVTLAGEQPPAALEAAWSAADAFVLPSSHEGYGMAYAEAMVRGLPVIGTTAGAIPDTVPASAGLLVAPGDVDALRGALRSVLVDPLLRARLAAGALRAADALPDWPEAVRRWAEAADRLAA